MKYFKPLSSNEIILLYLKEILNHNTNICQYILKLKNKIFKIDNSKYHQERYEKIAKEHYYLHKNQEHKFSYIFDVNRYVVKNDFDLTYYKYTGISYQIVELIHDLIRNKKKYNNEYYDKFSKMWIDYDDNLYFILADKITTQMNKSKGLII